MFRVMKYIKHTINHCVKFENYIKLNSPWKVYFYSDSDWEGDSKNRKNINGWIFLSTITQLDGNIGNKKLLHYNLLKTNMYPYKKSQNK